MKPIKMNIPDAKDVEQAMQAGAYQKAVQQAARVEALINESIAEGNGATGGDGWLLPAVKAALEAKGYKVTNGSHRNESYWTVSWTKPTRPTPTP